MKKLIGRDNENSYSIMKLYNRKLGNRED